jgi:Predicted membrane protein
VRFILNVIWLLFAGLWLALGYALLGIVAFLLIVTIPFGVASFRMANYALWPFGRTVVAKPDAGAGSVVGNIIWLVIAGIPIVAGHLSTAAAQAVTIIGIPLAIANIKMIPISLFPFGKEIVPVGAVPPGYTAVHTVVSEGDRLSGSAVQRAR